MSVLESVQRIQLTSRKCNILTICTALAIQSVASDDRPPMACESTAGKKGLCSSNRSYSCTDNKFMQILVYEYPYMHEFNVAVLHKAEHHVWSNNPEYSTLF